MIDKTLTFGVSGSDIRRWSTQDRASSWQTCRTYAERVRSAFSPSFYSKFIVKYSIKNCLVQRVRTTKIQMNFV